MTRKELDYIKAQLKTCCMVCDGDPRNSDNLYYSGMFNAYWTMLDNAGWRINVHSFDGTFGKVVTVDFITKEEHSQRMSIEYA